MATSRRQSATPDLFSASSARDAAPDAPQVLAPSRHVLPNDLSGAIKHLDDQEFDQLLSAVLTEQQRRGKKTVAVGEPAKKRQVAAAAVALTTGKLNAVRAAFRAGVTPSRIARQFGLSQSDVRKALASDHKG